MRTCSKCVLPETFPGIRFNEDNVCNFCQGFKGIESLEKKRTEYRERFAAALRNHRGKSTYDGVMSYSGGKDSTYTLLLLKKEYGLNLLAVTYDNGFMPEQTFKNIRNVAEHLAIDHILFKPRFDLLKKVFRESVRQDFYPPKTLERASTICTSCMSVVKFGTLRTALEKNIPFIAFGWSPGQAPITSSLMKNNPAMVMVMQNALLEPLRRVAGESVAAYFLEDRHFRNAGAFPYNVSPLAFHDYNEERILKEIASLGWENPKETDSNSTNCLLNSFANRVHKERLKFHPYALEIAGLVRAGLMSREEGLAKIGTPETDGTVAFVRQRLELSE